MGGVRSERSLTILVFESRHSGFRLSIGTRKKGSVKYRYGTPFRMTKLKCRIVFSSDKW